jgi:hypothetical protein
LDSCVRLTIILSLRLTGRTQNRQYEPGSDYFLQLLAWRTPEAPNRRLQGSGSITNQADAELSKQAYERVKSLVGERAPISCDDYFGQQ